MSWYFKFPLEELTPDGKKLLPVTALDASVYARKNGARHEVTCVSLGRPVLPCACYAD